MQYQESTFACQGKAVIGNQEPAVCKTQFITPAFSQRIGRRHYVSVLQKRLSCNRK